MPNINFNFIFYWFFMSDITATSKRFLSSLIGSNINDKYFRKMWYAHGAALLINALTLQIHFFVEVKLYAYKNQA